MGDIVIGDPNAPPPDVIVDDPETYMPCLSFDASSSVGGGCDPYTKKTGTTHRWTYNDGCQTWDTFKDTYWD